MSEDTQIFKLKAEDFTTVLTEMEDKGIAIFFTYLDDETITSEAAITDNFVETNHAVQDHIAIKPRIYRLRGCIGEVTYRGSNEWLKSLNNKINSNPVLKKTFDAMKPISAISGYVGNATQSAINIVNQLESSYNRYKKLIEDNFITARQRKLTNKMQETTVAYLNRILELRIPVSLKGLKFETTLNEGNDYKRLYYLQSVSSHQGSNNYITDIEITIKEFRVATTKIVDLDKEKYGMVSPKAVIDQPEVNKGDFRAQDVEKSVQDKVKDALSNIKKNHPIVSKWVEKGSNALIYSNPAFNFAKSAIDTVQTIYSRQGG
jgi:hypothetical protein